GQDGQLRPGRRPARVHPLRPADRHRSLRLLPHVPARPSEGGRQGREVREAAGRRPLIRGRCTMAPLRTMDSEETGPPRPAAGAARPELVEREERWRRRWLDDPPVPFDVDTVPAASKFYNLVEFPYPSAEGLHVGHVYTYCGADTLGRYQRQRG